MAVTPTYGLFEYGSESGLTPTVIIGPTVEAVDRRAAQLAAEMPGIFSPDAPDTEEMRAYIAEHGTPDYDDPGSVRAWLTGMEDHTCVPWYTRLSDRDIAVCE